MSNKPNSVDINWSYIPALAMFEVVKTVYLNNGPTGVIDTQCLSQQFSAIQEVFAAHKHALAETQRAVSDMDAFYRWIMDTHPEVVQAYKTAKLVEQRVDDVNKGDTNVS